MGNRVTRVSTDGIDLKGKRVVITGGNAGIGRATVFSLANLGAECIMGCRSEQRATEAISDLVARGIDSSLVKFVPLDLSSLRSVKIFAEEIIKRGVKVDYLVLNAGLMSATDGKTADGFEIMFGVNHLAHFYLTKLLLEANILADDGRIVVLSSMSAAKGKLALDQIRGIGAAGNFSGLQGYANSKLYNILMCRSLQAQLRQRGSKIDVFAVHPGMVRTEFLNEGTSGTFRATFKTIVYFVGLSAEDGARTSVFAVTSPQLTGQGFQYLADSKVSTMNNPLLADDQAEQELWKRSEELIQEFEQQQRK